MSMFDVELTSPVRCLVTYRGVANQLSWLPGMENKKRFRNLKCSVN